MIDSDQQRSRAGGCNAQQRIPAAASVVSAGIKKTAKSPQLTLSRDRRRNVATDEESLQTAAF
jgi:hypothetical protein